jgi:hypothetical protein
LQWPLLGIALHGIGKNLLEAHGGDGGERLGLAGESIDFSDEMLRVLMYGPDQTFDPHVLEQAGPAKSPTPVYELVELREQWPQACEAIAKRVRVPVHYRIAEFDRFWLPGDDQAAEFARLFEAAPSVQASGIRGTGHNIDHHFVGPGLHLEQLGFAWRCAVAAD